MRQTTSNEIHWHALWRCRQTERSPSIAMNLRVGNIAVHVRPGTVEDVPVLLSMIRAMAAFERLDVTATEDLLRQSLFGSAPAARTLLAFVDGQPIAYAVYFFTFSTMVGKRGLWLEDLFVTPDFRGRGIGTALMAYLARVAIDNDCGRFEWIVLDWNERAIRFYEDLQARLLPDWRVCRLDSSQLPALASRLPNRDDSRVR